MENLYIQDKYTSASKWKDIQKKGVKIRALTITHHRASTKQNLYLNYLRVNSGCFVYRLFDWGEF